MSQKLFACMDGEGGGIETTFEELKFHNLDIIMQRWSMEQKKVLHVE